MLQKNTSRSFLLPARLVWDLSDNPPTIRTLGAMGDQMKEEIAARKESHHLTESEFADVNALIAEKTQERAKTVEFTKEEIVRLRGSITANVGPIAAGKLKEIIAREIDEEITESVGLTSESAPTAQETDPAVKELKTELESTKQGLSAEQKTLLETYFARLLSVAKNKKPVGKNLERTNIDVLKKQLAEAKTNILAGKPLSDEKIPTVDKSDDKKTSDDFFAEAQRLMTEGMSGGMKFSTLMKAGKVFLEGFKRLLAENPETAGFLAMFFESDKGIGKYIDEQMYMNARKLIQKSKERPGDTKAADAAWAAIDQVKDQTKNKELTDQMKGVKPIKEITEVETKEHDIKQKGRERLGFAKVDTESTIETFLSQKFQDSEFTNLALKKVLQERVGPKPDENTKKATLAEYVGKIDEKEWNDVLVKKIDAAEEEEQKKAVTIGKQRLDRDFGFNTNSLSNSTDTYADMPLKDFLAIKPVDLPITDEDVGVLQKKLQKLPLDEKTKNMTLAEYIGSLTDSELNAAKAAN